MRLGPSSKSRVVVKVPSVSMSISVPLMLTTAFGDARPDTGISGVLTTVLSIGDSTTRKSSVGRGVGVGVGLGVGVGVGVSVGLGVGVGVGVAVGVGVSGGVVEVGVGSTLGVGVRVAVGVGCVVAVGVGWGVGVGLEQAATIRTIESTMIVVSHTVFASNNCLIEPTPDGTPVLQVSPKPLPNVVKGYHSRGVDFHKRAYLEYRDQRQADVLSVKILSERCKRPKLPDSV